MPIDCIFVSFMHIGDACGCPHDMVLNTGSGVVVGVRIMHRGNTGRMVHMLSSSCMMSCC